MREGGAVDVKGEKLKISLALDQLYLLFPFDFLFFFWPFPYA